MVYNINPKRVNIHFIPSIVTILIGILFLVIFGGIVYSGYNKIKVFDGKIQAYNIEWQKKEDEKEIYVYSPTYYYDIDNISYTCTSNEFKNVKSGNGIVYYDTNNPSKCLVDFEIYDNIIISYFLILPIIILLFGFIMLFTNIKRKLNLRKLSQNGTLVKGVPYQAISTNKRKHDKNIIYLSIEYIFPDGISRTLYSDTFTDDCKLYGYCDLLYDNNNFNNYYIDFEITTTGIGEPNVIFCKEKSNNLNDDNCKYGFGHVIK